MRRQYFAGLIDAGFWSMRPRDAVAVLFTYVSGERGILNRPF